MTHGWLRGLCTLVAAAGTLAVFIPPGHAGPPPRAGGRGGQQSPDAQRADRELFHYLLDHRAAIRRTVTPLRQGVETLTESDEPQVTARIQQHVQSMHARMKEGRPIHRRDPLFAALFQHADEIDTAIELTDGGVRVRQTSEDAYAVDLIKAHANAVSLFLANGYTEVQKDHVPPPRD